MEIESSSKPDFFLIGAPRSGSTALNTYLREHSGIFLPRMKEPHFFAEELDQFRRIRSAAAYQELFSDSQPHQLIGEASVYYLYFPKALHRIQAWNPNAKILVMVRNPVDLVYSMHEQLLATFHEDQEDFQTAWNLQADRAVGDAIPAQCMLPQILQYSMVGRLGQALRDALKVFDKENVHVIVFDEFVANTRQTYLQVLEFLGIPDDGRQQFPRVNQSRANRSRILGRLMGRPPAWLKSAKTALRKGLGEPVFKKMTGLYLAGMTRKRVRSKLDPEMRLRLCEEFRDDVALLADILEKDLQDWASANDEHQGRNP